MFGGEGARKFELQDMTRTLRRVAGCETAKHVEQIFRFENRMQELKETMSREESNLKLCWNVHTVTNRYPCIMHSDVPALAWPESPGFGLALGGLGFVKSQARPKAKKLAWAGAYQRYHMYIIIFNKHYI